MPNRIVREGILTSERVNSLSQGGELFYRRLLSVVDDFGRYFANPTLLRASCYPLKLDSVKEDSISKHLAECVGARLIVLYTVADKAYLELQDFRQQVRAKASKYPAPDMHMRSACAAHAQHMQACAHLDVDVDVDVDVDEKHAPRSADAGSPQPSEFSFPLNNGSEYRVSTQDLATFRDSYPALDVEQQLRELRAWCVANPRNRKTRSGALKFVNGWLSRSQNRAPRAAPSPTAAQASPAASRRLA